MYDRQATTFLSHRLGRVLAQGQLPFNLYGLLLRSSTGEVVAYSGVSTQPGQIHDATREARLVVLPSWQGVAGKKRSTIGRVCHVSSSCHWHSDGPAPLLLHSISISYHFWSFQVFFSTAIVTSASRIWNRSQVECHGGWHDEGFRPTVFCQDLQPGAGRVTWHHLVNVKWVSWG